MVPGRGSQTRPEGEGSDPRSGTEGYTGLAWQKGCDTWKVQRYGGEQKGVQFRQLPMARIHGDQYAGVGEDGMSLGGQMPSLLCYVEGSALIISLSPV